MFRENLMMLRSIHGYSQEEIAEKLNISRQAYAKWESGTTLPDIEKCSRLASIYGTTIDSLMHSDAPQENDVMPYAPQGKNIWGSVTINDRGQIVIPKGAREKFNLVGGTRIIVLSDEEGIALVSAKRFEENMQRIIELASKLNDKE